MWWGGKRKQTSSGAGEQAGLSPDAGLREQSAADLAAQQRLAAAALQERTDARAALVAVAEAACPAVWATLQLDRPSPATTWTAAAIGRFIRQHLPPPITSVAQIDLSAAYERQAAALTAALAELHQLRRRLREAQGLIDYQGRQLAQYQPAPEAEPPAPRPPVDVQALEAVPSDRLDALVAVMATTGLARSDALRGRLAEIWGVSAKSSRVGIVVRAALHRQLVAAQPCTVEWPGPKRRAFLTLTPLGRARAVALGQVPVADEYAQGLRAHKTPEHLYLVLHTAGLLRATGAEEVATLPECLTVGGGEYCPDLRVWESDRAYYVECERSHNKRRVEKWQRAGRANGGTIRLVTPNRRIMQAMLREIAVTTEGAFRVWAFNISEHAAGVRGPDGSVWAYRG